MVVVACLDQQQAMRLAWAKAEAGGRSEREQAEARADRARQSIYASQMTCAFLRGLFHVFLSSFSLFVLGHLFFSFLSFVQCAGQGGAEEGMGALPALPPSSCALHVCRWEKDVGM